MLSGLHWTSVLAANLPRYLSNCRVIHQESKIIFIWTSIKLKWVRWYRIIRIKSRYIYIYVYIYMNMRFLCIFLFNCLIILKLYTWNVSLVIFLNGSTTGIYVIEDKTYVGLAIRICFGRMFGIATIPCVLPYATLESYFLIKHSFLPLVEFAEINDIFSSTFCKLGTHSKNEDICAAMSNIYAPPTKRLQLATSKINTICLCFFNGCFFYRRCIQESMCVCDQPIIQ